MDSNLPAMWVTALDQAILIWNGIPECSINLRKVSSGGDINIEYKLLTYHSIDDDWAFARGDSPFMGEVGEFIKINERNEDYFNSSLFSDVNAKLTMAHEIGHTIGFHHNHATSDSLHIPGTDSDEPSIMSSSSLSESDILAAQILYPGPPEWPGSNFDNPIHIEQYTWNQIVDLSHGYAWVEMELNQYPSGAGWQIHHTNNGQFSVKIEGVDGIPVEYSGASWSYQAQANKQNRLVKITYRTGCDQILIQCW